MAVNDLKTGIGVGDAQVVKSVIPKVQSETPFKTIQKRQDVELKYKREQEKLKEAKTAKLLEGVNTNYKGANINDFGHLAALATDVKKDMTENGPGPENEIRYAQKVNALAQAYETSRQLEEDIQTKRKMDEDARKTGKFEFTDTAISDLKAADSTRLYEGPENHDKWMQDVQSRKQNLDASFIPQPVFDTIKYRSVLASDAAKIKANQHQKTVELPDENGIMRSFETANYNPEQRISEDFDNNLSMQTRYGKEFSKLPADAQAKYTKLNPENPAKALAIETLTPFGTVNVSKQTAQSTGKSKGYSFDTKTGTTSIDGTKLIPSTQVVPIAGKANTFEHEPVIEVSSNKAGDEPKLSVDLERFYDTSGKKVDAPIVNGVLVSFRKKDIGGDYTGGKSWMAQVQYTVGSGDKKETKRGWVPLAQVKDQYLANFGLNDEQFTKTLQFAENKSKQQGTVKSAGGKTQAKQEKPKSGVTWK